MSMERLLYRFLGGHVTIGPVIIYGGNAMHWAVNVRVRGHGYLCFRLPLRCFGRWWPLYAYWSPNATPWAARWIIGGGFAGRERRAELARRPAPIPRGRADRNE